MTVASEATTRPDRTTLGAFLLFVTLAGGNVIAVRSLTCETCELDPFWAAGTRFTAASAILVVIAFARQASFPHGRALVGALLYGVLGFGLPFALAYWGFQHVSAGFGAVLLATVPLLTFAFAVAHRLERFRWSALLGGVLAFAGTAVIFGEGIGAGIPVGSLVALLAAAVCFAETNIVVKAFPRVDPAALNAIGLGVGGLMNLVLTIAYAEAHVLPEEVGTWLAQVYLVVIGSVVVFSLYVFVIRRWTASAVSYEGVLIPLVAIVLAWWLQDEAITWSFAGGAALVLAGVYVGALRGATEHA